VPFWPTSFITSSAFESFQYFLRGLMRFFVIPHEFCCQGYYGLIYSIWPVCTHTSLDSRAVHHARIISDNTDLLKMIVNLKYSSTFSSYRAIKALLVYKGWLTADWNLLSHDAVKWQSAVRQSIYTKQLELCLHSSTYKVPSHAIKKKRQ